MNGGCVFHHLLGVAASFLSATRVFIYGNAIDDDDGYDDDDDDDDEDEDEDEDDDDDGPLRTYPATDSLPLFIHPADRLAKHPRLQLRYSVHFAPPRPSSLYDFVIANQSDQQPPALIIASSLENNVQLYIYIYYSLLFRHSAFGARTRHS
jgi:hypothetical protein